MKIIRILLIFISTIFVNHTLFSQELKYSSGQIIDSIKVKREPNQTYQLYIPNNFTDDMNWPVVFIFDPGARGTIGIKPFITSAEAYGYILICSNNSRNNPFTINYKIADFVFSDAIKRLPIDTSMIYLAGFSGGSRLSSSIASNNKIIKGIVACGAGLPPKNFFNTMTDLSFSFAGIVGDRDMNYLEMINNKEYLKKLKLSNTLFIYEGDHSWPPDSIVLRAFDWLEIENLRKNNSKNINLVKLLYNKDYSIALKNEISNKLTEAYSEYMHMLNVYSYLIEIDSIAKKISELEKNKSYKKQYKNKLRFESNEEELIKSYFERLAVDAYTKADTIYDYWKIEGEKIQRTIKSKNIEASKMAERIQSNIWLWCYESGLNFKKNNDIDYFVFTNRLWVLFKPSDIYPNFQLAKYYATIGKIRKSLKYLEHSVQNGLNDKTFIKDTDEFKILENNNRFKKILSSINE